MLVISKNTSVTTGIHIIIIVHSLLQEAGRVGRWREEHF